MIWAVLTLAMLFIFGPAHPRTEDEDEPLDPARLSLAAVAVLMFVMSFTPVPVELLDLIPSSTDLVAQLGRCCQAGLSFF